MDEELLKLCTASVQSHAKLIFHMKNNTKKENVSQPTTTSVIDKSNKIMDDLREMRSELEGTNVTFEKTFINEAALQQLKQLTLMHVPGSLTADIKDKMSQLVREVFQDSIEKVLFCGLVSCPWYLSTQSDRGLQAKHNCLFVVYQNKTETFFSPVNPHDREQAELVDRGWFYAAELFHFSNHLVLGKVRFVELLFLPEKANVYASEEWHRLRKCLNCQDTCNLKGFMEQCRGQAVGGVGKKSKADGKMKLQAGATLLQFCESFRLLQYASQTLAQCELTPESTECPTEPDIARRALSQLQQAYKNDGDSKQQLFETVLEWRDLLNAKIKGTTYTTTATVEAQLGASVSQIRRPENMNEKPLGVDSDKKENLSRLMEDIGGPVADMSQDQILVVARAGSQLYGLTTQDSDVDYLVIYADHTEKLLSSCRRMSESVESRGPAKTVEYGAYEARLFAEMIWKGSVVIAELLFVDELDYTSDAWTNLVNNRDVFITERLILQYIGLIRNNLHMVETGRHRGTPRERKLFYQMFHKLYCLDYLSRGEAPQVRCSGQTKTFIMRIRKGPLEGDLHRDTLYNLVKERLLRLQEVLANRTKRLPEDVNYKYLTEWLLSVRGFGPSFHGQELDDKGAAMSSSIKSAASEENNSTLQKHHVFFDVETTGLAVNSEIIQIAATTTSGDTFDRYLLPTNAIPARVTKVNRLSLEDGVLMYEGDPVDAGQPGDVLKQFLNWLPSDTLLFAHNAPFDARMLMFNCLQHGLSDLVQSTLTGFCDTLRLFREVLPDQKSYKQTHLVTNILGEDYDAHNAAADVSALYKLYDKCDISEECIQKYCFTCDTTLRKIADLEKKHREKLS